MTINNDTFFRPESPSVHPITSNTPTTPNLDPLRLATLTSHNTIECVVDYDGVTAHTIGGVVVDSWDCRDRMLLGVDQIARIAFFSDDFSMRVFAYDLDKQDWLVDLDPDFPRFALDEDPFDPTPSAVTTILDLDSGRRHQLLDAEVVIPSRLSA